MQVKPVNPPSVGIDTVCRLDASACNMLRVSHVSFVVRHLHGKYGLTNDEVATIINSGLGLMISTPFRAPGWVPSSSVGAQDANIALITIDKLKLPPMTVWLNLNGHNASNEKTCEWVDSWSYAIKQEGHTPGLYVGASDPPADMLYTLSHIERFWRSSLKVQEPEQGWCMHQLRPTCRELGKLTVSYNTVEADYTGNFPTAVFP
jgi:hypothetical protein